MSVNSLLQLENKPATTISVGCLFAAIGGFCKAFQQGGAQVLWVNEKDKFATETFRFNFPEVRCIEKDVENLSVHGDHLQAVDILTAGFPCQAFSIAGEKKGFKDPRGLLFLHIIRIIKEFGINKPKILLLENVKNLKTHDNGMTFKRIQTEIQKAGYWFPDTAARIMNTVEYTDIPQNRERLFMVALSQNYFTANTFVFPEPVSTESLRPVRDFLDLGHEAAPIFYFTQASQYYDLFRDAIEKGGEEHIYQLRRSYVRKNMSGMCFTLMANMGEGGHNQPVIKDHWGIRKLTPKECARLQGYEDGWFNVPPKLSLSQTYKQIGNSVTVPLVARLAERIILQIQTINGRNEE